MEFNRSWYIRAEHDPFDPKEGYVSSPNLFTAEIHYGGIFKKSPGRKYVGGRVKHVDDVDIDKFSVHEFHLMVQLFEFYPQKIPLYYHFLTPGKDLDIGLEPFGNDQDVMELSRYIPDHKVILFYIEHEKTNVDTFLKSPGVKSSVIIEELPDENVTQIKARKKLIPRRKLLLEYDMNHKIVDVNVDANAKTVDVEDNVVVNHPTRETREVCRLDDLENGFEDLDFSQLFPKETEDNQEGEGHTLSQEGEGHNVSHREGHLLNNNEWCGDEWSGHQNRNETSSEEGEGDYGNSDDSSSSSEDDDSQDSDFRIGKEDLLDDVDVDMTDYVDEMEEYVGRKLQLASDSDDEDSDAADMDHLDCDSFVDGSTNMDSRRGSKTLQKGSSSIKDVRFFVGQKFGTKKEANEMIKRHAIETRRDLTFKVNDPNRIRVVCEGTTPENEELGPEVGPKTITGSSNKKKGNNMSIGMKKQGESCSGSGDTPLNSNTYYSLKRRARLTQPFCPFVLYISKPKQGRETWKVVTYKPSHTCVQIRESAYFTSKFMSEDPTIMSMLDGDQNTKVKTIQTELTRKYELNVSRTKAFRAREHAKRRVLGDYREQYKKLRDYGLELQKSNPNTTVHIEVERENNPSCPTRVFKRIYICLGPLKLGFKACRRDIIGLDGAFLKGHQSGQVLVAVGLDPNNGIYPVAYAVAESENKDSWTWFLTCLQDDLDLDPNCNFTFISDRQKGLIPALAQVFPAAEHRFCIRHIEQNMKENWRGKAYKDMLRECSMAKTVPEFTEKMEELRKFNVECHKWLSNISPHHWTRSHFTGRAKTDLLINNICEGLNSKTVDGREKPIISCLEYIREYLMKRIVNVMQAQEKWHGFLTPRATEIFERMKKYAAGCTMKWCGDSRYQVTGTRGQYVVDVEKRECTCRYWELTSIPCKHAVAVNWDMVHHKQQVGSPESWVDPCYRFSTWKEVYKYKIGPTNGPSLWPKSDCPTTLIAPAEHAQIGRPKKKRRKGKVELQDIAESQGKLSRKGGTVTCSNCGDKGHNIRGCKQPKGGQVNEGEAADGGAAGVADGGAVDN